VILDEQVEELKSSKPAKKRRGDGGSPKKVKKAKT